MFHNLLKFITIIALLQCTISNAYYGPESSEAQLDFKGHISIVNRNVLSKAYLKSHPIIKQNILNKIALQVQHLMGTFQSESFAEKFRAKGVMGENYETIITSVKPTLNKNEYDVTYSFSGKVVFQKKIFKNNSVRSVPIKLPYSPELIYSLGVVDDTNLCTDLHYNSEGDFWYFWDPDQDGCPLKNDSNAVFRTLGTLTEIQNTVLTYPDYDKLYADNGNGNDLDISIFLGYIEEIYSLKNPNYRDEARTSFKIIDQLLQNAGYALIEEKNKFRISSDGDNLNGINYFRRYEKELNINGNTVLAKVSVLLSDTAMESRDSTFHKYLSEALKNSDIVIYDGHSGLGGNLDVSQLPDISFDPNKYQILFFNGCSSYPYYNGIYFEAKGNVNNLDVVTAGLPTLTDTSASNVFAFLENFLNGTTKSWQKILWNLEHSNGENGTYLTGVNGDEDNTWSPKSSNSPKNP